MFEFAHGVSFEGVAAVGEKIQAFDFMPMSDRPWYYVIGTVIDKGMIKHPEYGCDMFEGYTIICEEDTCMDRVGEEIYVPFEMCMSDFTGRVRLVEGSMGLASVA